MKKPLAAITAMAAVSIPSVALAHTGHGGAAVGFLHPFTGIDHLFALLALGVVASQMKAGRALLLGSVLVAVLAAAFSSARAGLALPAQEPMLAASLLGLGALIVMGNRMSFGAKLAVGAVFTAYHGAAHGRELEAFGFGTAFPGFLLACLLLAGGSYVLGRLLASRATLAATRYQEVTAAVSMVTGVLLLS